MHKPPFHVSPINRGNGTLVKEYYNVVIGLHIFAFWLTVLFFHAQNKPVYAAYTINWSHWFDPQHSIPCAVLARDNIFSSAWEGRYSNKPGFLPELALQRGVTAITYPCKGCEISTFTFLTLRNSNFKTFFCLVTSLPSQYFNSDTILLFSDGKKNLLFMSLCSPWLFEQQSAGKN